MEYDYSAKYAGNVLRRLIKENYRTQEDFAFEFHTDIKNVSRYVNNGINKVATLQELAIHFNVSIKDFFPDTIPE